MSTTTDHDQVEQAATAAIPDAGLRRQLAPWAAMGLLALAAGAARIAVHASGEDAEVAATVATTAFVAAVVAATRTRRRVMSRHARHRLVAALYLGATWVSAVTVAGFSLGALTALTVLGSLLSLMWWREHRIGPDQSSPAGGGLIEPGDDDLYITRWATYLGDKGKALAGSYLSDPQIIKAGYRYTLNLVPGAQTVGTVRSMVETLRGGLRLMPGQDVIVEVHPERPAPTGILTIVTRPPIRRSQPWPGPDAGVDAASGSVNLGPFADGEGVARLKVYQRDGMFGGYLQGAPGSGKSRMIDQVAMSLAASTTHPTVIWYGDGQNGDSSPLLVEHADWAATTPAAVYNMLQAAVNVMRINGVENRLAKRVGFTPTADRPGLLVILDEIHKLTSKAENPLLAGPTQLLMATVAREGRKVGVALLCADQSPTLDAFGGSGNIADTLRASLLAGNGVILRSETGNAKQVFNVNISPRSFPALPGYAYLARPEVDARSAPFRGYWVTDEMAEVLPGRITWRSLPTRQANVAGRHYARRDEVAVEQALADQLLLQMADSGQFEDLEELVQQLGCQPATVDTVDVIEFGDAHPPVRRVGRFWMPEARNPAGLLPGQQKVLDAIRAGHTRPKALVETTGYSESQIYNLLGDLIRLGAIAKAGYGQYQAA